MNKTKRVYHIILLSGIALAVVVSAYIGKKNYARRQSLLVSEALKAYNSNFSLVNEHKGVLIDSLAKEKSFVYTGESKGYNGPVKVLILADSGYKITSVNVLSQSETHSYYQRLNKTNYLERFKSLSIQNALEADVVSGATKSSNAIRQAIYKAYLLGENIEFEDKSQVRFGVLEMIIMLLFILAILNAKLRNPVYVKIIFWAGLLLSLIFLGFIYNAPITTAKINSLILGSWPSLATELYIYVLLVGSVASILFTGKNFYCNSICPFGAAQELVGKLGNPKQRKHRYSKLLKRLQWTVSFIVIVVALVTHNPGKTEYEIYGGLFSITATAVGFALLILVLISSLFVKRPWCRYLCPLDGVFRYFHLVRKQVKGF